ncbi:MAG: OmpA family protein [Alphaproteobacteria bacterium]
MAGLLWGWLAIGGLAACSSVPDAVNPVEWYRGVAGVFEDDEQQQERAEARTAREATPLPGANQPYPNLASVPERPVVTPSAERGKIAQGLAADRENARYAESAPERQPTIDPTPPAAVPAPPQVARPPVQPPEPMPMPPQPAPQSAALPPPAMQTRQTPAPIPATPQSATFPQGVTQSATVFFANNSAVIDAEGRRGLEQLATSFKQHGGSIRIVGFASGQAASANAQIANFRIASQRAEAAAQALARLGVPMNRMIISSGNAGAVDAALARRVEVSLDY